MLRQEKPHVVILGGGFGGLAAAKALRDSRVRITLVDRTNHHLFQPLLYQVATAALAAPEISAPIRQLLWRQRNVTVFMSAVQQIDVQKKRVLLETTHLDYDYLVVATGMTHAYFGYDAWAKNAPGLKTIGEALDVRRRILRAFEAAELETSSEQRRAWTTFVVIGGGPTGVEMAGALAEIAGRTLARDFRSFDPRTTRVILVEAGKRILSTFSETSSESAKRQLESLGVEVRCGTPVSDLSDDHVDIGDERISTRTVLWAAGVRASPLASQLGVPVDRAGRVWVEDDLTVPDRPEIFVVGDLIAKTQDGKPLPGVAQLAMQSGKHAAKNITHNLAGIAREPFRYVDKGSMATIGRNKAVAQIGKLEFSGFIAWWLWLTVHLLFLVEFRRRLMVIVQWAFSYFTWKRSSRVILEVPAELSDARPPDLKRAILRKVDPSHSVPPAPLGRSSRPPARLSSKTSVAENANGSAPPTAAAAGARSRG